MDDLKKKFQKQLRAVEEQMEAAQSKANSADKDRRRLLAEVEDVSVEAERVRQQCRSVREVQGVQDISVEPESC